VSGAAPWNPPSGWGGPQPFGVPTNAPGSPAIRPQETAAIRALRTAAILGIVGIVLGFFLTYGVALAEGAPNPFSALSLVTPSGSGNTTTLTVHANAIWTLAAVVGVGAAVGLVGLFFYYRTFAHLKSFDARFSTPATLTILLMVGVVLLVLGVVLVFHTLVGANGCVFGGSNPPACATSLLGPLLASLALLGIGGIIALVGAIGLLIGIWRIGTRYDSTLLHVAAILYIIPFASVVAPILTLIEAGAIERRLATGATGPLLSPPSAFPPPSPPGPPR
jgi:hypothetical protein